MNATVVNDVRISFTDRGEGDAILFIHGYPLNHTMWEHQLGALAGWRRIAPDLRGMGGSEAPASGYSMEAYAADLAGVLDACGVERVVLCGLSMGGYVLFECLRSWGGRVAGAVLMDTRAEADSAEARAGRDAMIQAVRERGPVAVAEAMLPKLVGPSTAARAPDVVEHARRMIMDTSVPGIIGALEAMKQRPDSRPVLSMVQVPVLIVVGEEDVITPPPASVAMAGVAPRAQLVVVPRAGHLAPMEQPAAVTEALQRFLRTAFHH